MATAAPVVSAPGKLPGISVSDAFGLPDNWTLAESLKGIKATGVEKIEPEPMKGEGTPDPDEMERQKAAEKEAAEKNDTIDADKKAADEAAAKAKETKEAAAAAKTAVPAKAKVEPKPKVEAKPAAAAPATAVEPKKIKIGDKEYTEDELKKRLEEPAKPAAVPAAKVEPAKPAAPAAKAEPTAAERQAEAEKTAKMESEWITGASKTLAPSAVDEATMEKILTGGRDAVAEFDRIRREDMARTVLAVRKDLDSLYKPFFEAVTRLESHHSTTEDQRAWADFTTAHPELAAYEQVVKQHAAALTEADPAGVQGMTQADFNTKVAELTLGYIRQFNPEFGKTPAVDPNAAAKPANDPAAVSAAAKTLAAAKAAEAAKIKKPGPPAGTVPGGAVAGPGARGNTEFQKSAVASLM